jgi:hypothetical protein
MMTNDERIPRVENEAQAADEFKGRTEEMSGGRERQAEGLADEIKDKLLVFKSRLQDALHRDDSDQSSSGRH